MSKLISLPVLHRVLRNSAYCSIKNFSSSASADPQKSHYDVIIAGGGLVGVSLAVSLGSLICLQLQNKILFQGSI